MDISLWYGIVAPAATPQPIVQRLNAELVKILDMPDIRKSFSQQGPGHEGWHTRMGMWLFLRRPAVAGAPLAGRAAWRAPRAAAPGFGSAGGAAAPRAR